MFNAKRMKLDVLPQDVMLNSLLNQYFVHCTATWMNYIKVLLFEYY